MVGSPPLEDRIIRFSDGGFHKFRQLRWSFSNMRQLVPTAKVARGSGCVVPLPRAERPELDAIAFTTMDGRTMTWMPSLPVWYADGIVVLHRGSIVYERYFGGLEPLKPHSAFSVTKSFVGTRATMLAAEGVIDPAAPVTRYLPEMKNTAYGDATVRQVIDMTIGVTFSEDYSDPNAEVFAYAHQGRTLAQLTAERIWSKLGAAHDAFYTVDGIGTASGGGGLGQIAVRGSDEADIRAKRPRATGRLGRGWRHHPSGLAGGGVTSAPWGSVRPTVRRGGSQVRPRGL